VLTQEQIDFFHDNGFLIMRQLFRGEELRLLREAAEETARLGKAREGEHHLYANVNGEQIYWRSEHMWRRGDIFLAATVNPELLENIGQIIGEPFRPYNDSLVVKVPERGAPVFWHQDPPFNLPEWSEPYPAPNFTTDIYLDESDPDNGCVYAIPGHHMVGHVDLTGKTEEELFEKYGAVPVVMQPGDVLFHAVSTPHGSRANRSGRERKVFYIHYMSPRVKDAFYPTWKKFDEVPELEQFAAARERLGFGRPEASGTIELTDKGIRFTGSPASSPDLWAKKIAAMPRAEIEAKRKLLMR